MAATVKQSVLRLKPERAKRVASVMSILVALCWGLLAGLVVCVPAGYYYRFWHESGPLRRTPDYARSSIAAINPTGICSSASRSRMRFWAIIRPPCGWGPGCRSAFLQAADEIIERYRNNSDPAIRDFDWPKAAVCLDHALEMDRNDRAAQGKLALANGYINLIRADSEQGDARSASSRAAQENFQEAVALIPRSPDPHLGLARIYVYSVKNIGKAMAELHEAAGLGFQAGPRELEEEADGYRFRATAPSWLMRARRMQSRGPPRSAICGWHSAISSGRASSTSRS